MPPVSRPPSPSDLAVTVEIVGVGEGEVPRRAHTEMHDLAGLADVLDLRADKDCVRVCALHLPDHAGEVGERGGRLVRPGPRTEQGRESLLRISLVGRKCQHTDDQRREAEQGTGERHGDVERQSPDAEPIVQVGLLQALRPAPAQRKRILEDARVRQQAGHEGRQQSHAREPDDEHAPGSRQVQVDVQVGEELGPWRLGAHDEASVRVGQPAAFDACLVVVIADDQPGTSQGGGQDEHVMRGLVGERLRVSGCKRGGDGLGADAALHGRPVGLLPALQLVGEHGQRAAQANDIDEGDKRQAERRVAGQHGAHEGGRQKLALAGPCLDAHLHQENTLGRNATP